MKARVELRDVITIIYANQRQMRRHDPLQKYMEVVFEYAGEVRPPRPGAPLPLARCTTFSCACTARTATSTLLAGQLQLFLLHDLLLLLLHQCACAQRLFAQTGWGACAHAACTAERESPVKPSELANRNVEIDHLRAEDLEYNYDKKGLAALRRRLFWAIAEYRGARRCRTGAGGGSGQGVQHGTRWACRTLTERGRWASSRVGERGGVRVCDGVWCAALEPLGQGHTAAGGGRSLVVQPCGRVKGE